MRLVALSVRGIQVPALSQLASTHAHETLLWASKHKGARHTFNYDLINSGDPTSQLSSVWRAPCQSLHFVRPYAVERSPVWGMSVAYSGTTIRLMVKPGAL
jgi:hypothetical protein